MSTSATSAGTSAPRASSQVSVQLYTVREALAEDVAGTVSRLAELGFTSVEPFGPLALSDELAAALAEHHISAPTMHQGFLGSDDDAPEASREFLERARRLQQVLLQRWGAVG